MPTAFDIRWTAYTPGGAKITNPTTLKALSASVTIPYSDSSTASITVSSVVSGTIPTYLEVALEYWNSTSNTWVEPRDCRFIVNVQDTDTADLSGTVTLTGVGAWYWFLNKTYLNHVAAYALTGLSSRTTTTGTATASGTTLTSTAHGLLAGDRIYITNAGNAKGVKKGALYYVQSPTTNTFKISGSLAGTARNLGVASGITWKLLQDRVDATGHQFANDQKVTVTAKTTGANITVGQDYYIVRTSTNRFSLSTTINGISLELGNVSGLGLKRAFDGDRRFNAVTPGLILKTLIDEAQARSWGTFLSYDFTATTDSAGNAWPATYTVSVPPGTNGLSLLQLLANNNWVEYATDGRTLHVWATGHGTNRATGASPVTIGVKASSRPLKTSLDNLLTQVTTVSSDGKRVVNTSRAPGSRPLGELESYQTQSGVPDDGTSTALINKTINTTGSPNTQQTITEPLLAGAAYPFKDYQIGDTLRVASGAGYVAQNVVQLQLRVDQNGAAVADVMLGYRFKDPLTSVAQRQAAATGGVKDTATGVPATFPDLAKPSQPTGLTLTSDAAWNAGVAVATITAAWTAVTTDNNGNQITITDYEVWVRGTDDLNAVRAGNTNGDVQITIGGYQSNVFYYVSVRAKSSTDQWGPFTDELEVTTSVPITVLAPPTAPTLTSKLGVVSASWDGLLADPTNGNITPPPQFEYTYAAISTSSGGTYTPVGQHMAHAGNSATITGLTRGSTYWVEFFAVDFAGVVSSASTPASITVLGVTGPDIEANSVTANNIAVGTLEAMQITLGEQNPLGASQQRVPTPPTNTTWWGNVISGTIPLPTLPGGVLATQGCTAVTTGLQLIPTSLVDAHQYVTARLDIPSSKTLHAHTLASGTASTVQNLVQNPTCATATTDWAGAIISGGTVTTAQVTDVAASSLPKTTSTAFGVTAATTATSGVTAKYGQSASTTIAVTPGAQYTSSMFLFGTIAGTVSTNILVYNSSGTLIATSTGSGSVSLGAQTWARVTETYTIPATAARVVLQATFSTSLTAGESFYVTSAMFNAGALRPYFDGHYPIGSWAGVADASASNLLVSGVRALVMDSTGAALYTSEPLPEAQQWQFPLITGSLVNSGAPTGGTFTVTVTTNDGTAVTTPALPYSASAALLQDTLSALSNIATGSILVTGSAGAWTLAIFDGTITTVSATASYTGGTSPTITWTATTPAKYAVFVDQAVNGSTITYAVINIFEAVGQLTNQQSFTLTPAGVQLVNADGSKSISIGTATDDFFAISADQGLGPVPVATIDSSGAAHFAALTVDNDMTVRGTDLLGGFDDIVRNGDPDNGAVFDRLARGAVVTAAITRSTTTITAAAQTIANGKFTVAAGRKYMLSIDNNAIATNSLGGTATIEILLSDHQLAITDATGYSILHFVLVGTSDKYLNPLQMSRSFVVRASVSSNQFSTGTNYIMIRIRNSSSNLVWTANQSLSILTIEDIGPEVSNPDWSNTTTSGTPTAPANSTTTTWNCSFSAGFRSGGSTLITGSTSDLYNNPNGLYQGYGASARGSIFGFGALGLSGATISAASIYLQNLDCYFDAGVTARLGTSSRTSAGTSMPARANGWNSSFKQGQGKWVPIPSSLWAGIAAGTINSFTLGVSSSQGDYAYFAGDNMSAQPKLRITYQ